MVEATEDQRKTYEWNVRNFGVSSKEAITEKNIYHTMIKTLATMQAHLPVGQSDKYAASPLF